MPTPSSISAPLKVLIVDDEPLARDRLRTLLSDIAAQFASVVVGEAANGLAALDVLCDQAVDVVLADIRMPGMDGIELASHLGRLEKPPSVIFTTAYDNYAVQAFDLNAVDYLLKPVRTQRLLAALQKVPAQHPDAAVLAGIGQEVRWRAQQRAWSVLCSGMRGLQSVGLVTFVEIRIGVWGLPHNTRSHSRGKATCSHEAQLLGLFLEVCGRCAKALAPQLAGSVESDHLVAARHHAQIAAIAAHPRRDGPTCLRPPDSMTRRFRRATRSW